jgi:hypothetical protein
MVTFNSAGRFGNWYMEICTAIAYALKHDLDFHAPDNKGKDLFWNPVYALHLCNPDFNPSLEAVHLWEGKHDYEELPFDESWGDKNIIIEGYRQSEKYFKDYRNQILYLLDFPYQKKEGYVSVHVRRGDYLIYRNKHPEVTKEWYEKAMQLFEGYKFKFFSDEIAWCKREFGDRSDCEFSTNNDILADFIEMQNCEHFLNSSSTFSWAAAWHSRSEGKRIYTPKLWFVEGYSLETKDIIPDEWIKL